VTGAGPDVLPETPYVGLTPFGEHDAPFYFGRERERRLLAASILSSRLTLLYGASGVGKSSLLRAGLAADFRARAQSALARGRLPESVLVVCSGWRDDPLRALADAIEAAVRDQLGDHAPDPPPFTPRLESLLAEWLRRLDERAIELAPGADEPPHSELLLVLDQFEEYFLYHRDEDGDGTLALELPRAVMREDLRASFLVSIREDAYTQLDRFEGRIRNLFGSNFRLEHLDEPAARRAIEGPVERYNELLPAGNGRYAVEPELVDDVLQQVRAGTIALGQAGAGTVDTDGHGDVRVATPFLQLVLTRLWEEERRSGSHTLRAATLERLGGAERLVRSHLADALAELDDDARDLTAAVFHQLVTPSGTKIVHTVPDLAEYAEAPESELAPVLEALAAARILRPVDPAPGETSPRFEIFHDVLGPAILDWRAAHERARAARKEARRLRTVRLRLAAGGGGMLLLVVLFAGLAIWAIGQRDKAQTQAVIARSQALAASAVSQLDADPELGLLLAVEAAGAKQTQEAEDALRRALTASRLRAVVPGRGPVRSVAISPDDRRLLTVDGLGIGHVRRATAAGADVASFGAGLVNAAAFDPTGRLIVTANSDGTARILDADRGGERLVIHAGSAAVVAARFSRDGRRVLTVSRDGVARVFEARTGDRGAVVRVRPPLRRHLFSPGGEAVVVAGRGGDARVWRWQKSEPARKLDRSTLPGLATFAQGYGGAAVADDGRFALGGGIAFLPGQRPDDTTGRLQIVDARNGGRQTIFVPGGAGSIAFSLGGRFVATGGPETARIWDTLPRRFGRVLPVLRGHVDFISDVEFSPDGGTVLTSSGDGSVRLWRTATGDQLAVFRSTTVAAGAVFSPSGKLVATTRRGEVRVWAVDSVRAQFARRLPPVFENPPVGTITFTRDGSQLLAAGSSGAWTLEAGSGRIRHAFLPPSFPNGTYSVSPDGTLLADSSGVRAVLTGDWRWRTQLSQAVFSRDSSRMAFRDGKGNVGVWASRSGDVRILGLDPDAFLLGFTRAGAVVVAADSGTERVWPPDGSPSRPVRKGEGPYDAVAPAGGLSATRNDGRVHLWRGGAPAGDLVNPTGSAVTDVAFSPDGRSAATADEQGTVRVWDLATRRSLALRGHVAQVTSVSFSPSGQLVVTAGIDGTARVWQAATGASVAVLGGGGRSVFAAEFSPDGRFVATGGADRVVRLYDCEPCRPFAELLELARSRATRKLTPQERREFLGEG
jgi:WD40 repeat protein